MLSFWKLFCEVKKGFIMSEAVTIDTIKNILTKNVNKEYSLSREEAIAIMNLPEDDMPLLMEMAGSLRKKYKGNHVSIHLCTILPFESRY